MLNNVCLLGRITKDLEHKQTQSGVSVTSFSIAVERNYADKSTGKREADFINIVAWRGTADLICKYFSKGSLIALDGSIQTRNYEDKNGNKRQAVEVVANNVYFTGEKKADINITHDSPGKFGIGDFEEIDTDDSDLPF